MEPVLAYRFYIRILNGKKNTYLRAQSISGLSIDIEQREFDSTEGIKKIPSGIAYDKLVLKRAVLEKADTTGINTMETINELKVKRLDMGIHLLNALGKYTRSWNIIGAYPIKWSIGDFNATSNEVMMETLEFKYNYLREIR